VDIAAWLQSLGMQQYEEAFRDNAIDAAVLPELTADDLKDLGVNLVGHRRRLLAAIAALRSDDRLARAVLREVYAAYHCAVADVVKIFDGFVAKYMGDGVLVYFGYPQAHEDDAERAVRAGLGIIESVARLDGKSVQLHARIGIATGLVVVGDLIGEGSAQEQSVVGPISALVCKPWPRRTRSSSPQQRGDW